MARKAELSIRIWKAKGEKGQLPDDLDEAFSPHVEHVAGLVRQGYTSGEIVDDNFSGWWDIKA